MKPFLKYGLLALVIFIFIAFAYFFVGQAPEPKEIIWGVNFSQKHARDMGLNWKETYLATWPFESQKFKSGCSLGLA